MIIAWGGVTKSCGVLALIFRSEDQKVFRRELLGFILALTSVFRRGTRLYSLLGRGDRPRNTLQWHRACYFFKDAQSSLGDHISRLGGTSSDLRGHRPKCFVVPCLACSNCSKNVRNTIQILLKRLLFSFLRKVARIALRLGLCSQTSITHCADLFPRTHFFRQTNFKIFNRLQRFLINNM